MFANAKKILITTESHEVIIVRRGGEPAVPNFCRVCDAEVEMVNLDMAVRRSRIGGRELVHRTQTGEFHSIETPDGYLMICGRSLDQGDQL